jgi:hypothetical protein
MPGLMHACAMQLHYLAMAPVVPARLPALLDKIAAVLRWAGQAFGPAGSLQDEGEWDYELQATAEPDTPLDIA